MSACDRSKVIYITRTGMCEPLGQSQVLSYLRGLSIDYDFTLISFEKPEDLADTAAMNRVRTTCARHGLRWLPQRFRYRPSIIAPAVSILQLLWLCLRELRRGNQSLIHARSYVSAFVALVLYRITGTPFIFDMRALWPEELITSGRLDRGSLLHRAIIWAERACLRDAAAVVSLTHAAVDHLKSIYPNELENQRIAIIPTCTDLQRFAPTGQKQAGQCLYGCHGTVLSGWFRLDWLSAFFRAAALDPQARFEIVTRDNPEEVRALLQFPQSMQSRLVIYPAAPHQVHETIRKQNVSVMFYEAGLGRLGCSPTRMGEALGCGIPVVTNAGVGDVADIISSHKVGVLVADDSDAAMKGALLELNALLGDPGLAKRCRLVAEKIFSLDAGTEAYRILYQSILESSEI